MKNNTHETGSACHRRDILRLGAIGGLGMALGKAGLAAFAAEDAPQGSPDAPKLQPLDVVRVGYVGVGGQGTSHVRNLLKLQGVEIVAVCDIVEAKVNRTQKMVVKAGQRKPEGYSRGETDFRRLCERKDLDLVYTATPWECSPVCLAAMNHGKHAATEVPAAVTLDECWQLVETAATTGRHCVMMENCCYDRAELEEILNMVRKGLLGELIHADADTWTICADRVQRRRRGTVAAAMPYDSTAISIPRTGWDPSHSA